MSTLESAIAISLILILLVFMVSGPESVALESFELAKDGGNELFFMERDTGVISSNSVNGVVCYDVSPEKLCTYLTGVSDNFRLIYGSVFEVSKEENNEKG